MASKKYTTNQTGVRYKEKKRNRNGKIDRYYTIRYRLNGKLKEEGVGWASEGWNPVKVSLELADLKKAQLNGEGPQTLAEKRYLENEKREQERMEKERLDKETLSYSEYFNKRYYPEAQNNKEPGSYQREESLHRLWIGPVIGKMTFKDIRPFHLERIKKDLLSAKRSPRSIQYAFAVVRQVFNHAIKNEIFSGESPNRKVSRPKVDNKRERFLKRDEAELLLNELKSRSQQLYEMALISLYCGLRAGEIFNLTWGCIDLDQKTIRLMDTKGKVNRTAHLTETVHEVLRSKEQGSHSDLVFKSVKGDKIKEISGAFNRAVDSLGLNNGIEDPRHKVYFHSLRHTFASWLVQSGVSLYIVMKLLGHSSMTMTERYSHLANESLKDAVKKLENVDVRESDEMFLNLRQKQTGIK
jgi:integrase